MQISKIEETMLHRDEIKSCFKNLNVFKKADMFSNLIYVTN